MGVGGGVLVIGLLVWRWCACVCVGACANQRFCLVYPFVLGGWCGVCVIRHSSLDLAIDFVLVCVCGCRFVCVVGVDWC